MHYYDGKKHRFEIRGTERADTLVVDGAAEPADVIFVLRADGGLQAALQLILRLVLLTLSVRMLSPAPANAPPSPAQLPFVWMCIANMFSAQRAASYGKPWNSASTSVPLPAG